MSLIYAWTVSTVLALTPCQLERTYDLCTIDRVHTVWSPWTVDYVSWSKGQRFIRVNRDKKCVFLWRVW